jgi:addiction module toxin, RelE/StbE family
MHKYELVMTSAFIRDYKKQIKRHKDPALLDEIVELLLDGIPLPEKNRDHALSGEWQGFRECHIEPDWLLVYRIYENTLVLALSRTGTHSDLDF